MTRALISRRKFAQGSAATITAAGLLPTSARAEAKGGTLVAGEVTLRSLNPAIQSGNATGVPGTQIFAGLVQYDAQWQPHPYLAREWQASADHLTYTFKLVEDASFHDGAPITSRDVAFSLDIVKHYHPFGGPMFGPVNRVETPDPHTVVVRLSRPQPAFMICMSPLLLPILPQHVFDKGPIETNPANLKPIGSGPFKFVDYVVDDHITLERYGGYFRKGRPHLDRVIFKIMKDSVSDVFALQRGDIQYFPFAPILVRDIARLEKNPKLVVTQRGYEACGPIAYLEINTRKKPLDDVRVRRAIAYAVDKKFIVEELLLNKVMRLDGPLNHTNRFFASDDLVVYDLDLDKANKLLDDAGHKRQANGARFSLTLEWLPDQGPDWLEGVAQYLKPQLKKIGIDIQLLADADFASWARRISNWEHDLTMNGAWNYPDPMIGVDRLYLCSNQKKGVLWSNTEGYCNHHVDGILNAAAVETDSAKRKTLYGEFQRR
ncbi:MAG: ABC transporter substrate-binding protein, partial [Acetobacteraceae bacterium]